MSPLRPMPPRRPLRPRCDAGTWLLVIALGLVVGSCLTVVVMA